MSDVRKTYWIVSTWIFLALAVFSVFFTNPTMASVWVACALICNGTRNILDAIEAKSPTPNADEGEV